ncbi:MAG: MFS transporter [Immundisolibacteraceae bacterium]|nr:MFS transporter [Immundisolibacteraceae bacterium]
MATANLSLQQAIDQRPLSWLQIRVILLCWLVNLLDGFDLLAISFAAPAISSEWQLTPEALGIVFSSGLAGMTAGSLLLGPMADRIGRRRMIIVATLFLGVATLATSAAASLWSLLTLRFITGLAIGGLLPSLNTLVAEYSPDRRRNFAVSIMHLGFPVGGILGGALAAIIIPEHGWQSIFVVAGALTLIMVPLLVVGLPESLPFLQRQKTPAANLTAEKICTQMDIDWSSIEPSSTTESIGAVSQILRPPWLSPSVALWGCFFFGYLALYFLINWIPTILTNAGMSTGSAIGAGIAINIGGGIGMLTLGWLSATRAIRPMISVSFIISAGLMALLGQNLLSVNGLLLLTGITGFFGLGGLIGLYSVAARFYPDYNRASGVGLAIGAGRFGAILGPLIGGILIGMDWQMANYFLLLAIPLVLAGLIIHRVNDVGIEPPKQ